MRVLASVVIAVCLCGVIAGAAAGLAGRPVVVPSLDTSAPTVDILFPSGGEIRESMIHADGNATDADSGLQRVELRLNGGAWLEAFGVTPGSQHVEWYRGALDTVVGLNRLEARAWDVAGNPSATAHIDFTVRPWDLFIHVQPASRFFVPGEAVNYSVDMTNVGNETTALYWSSFCQAYITVEDQTGKEWLNQSRGQTCAPAFSNITLAPGERYTTNGSWDQRDNGRNPVPTPGCYVLRHLFHRYANLAEEPAIFGIGDSPFNTPPVATFEIIPSTGDTLTPFSVDASRSFDCHDRTSSLEVRWDWQADGLWDTQWTADKIAAHSYASPGPQTIRLEVRDSNGAVATASRVVTVQAAPDVDSPTINHMPPSQAFPGENLTIWAEVEDDGTIVSVQLTYSVASLAHNLDMVVRQPHLYAVEVIAPQSEATLRYHIVATDAAGHQTRLPTVGEFQIPLVPQSSLSPDLRSLGIGIGLGASAGSLAVAVAIWAWRIRRKGSPPSKEP